MQAGVGRQVKEKSIYRCMAEDRKVVVVDMHIRGKEGGKGV